MDLSQLQYGTLSTWLAFIAAGIAVGFTWRALVRERKRDALRELNERKAQANKFAVWLDREDRERRDNGDFVLMLRNASHLPIYDADMHILNLQDNLTIKEYSRPVVVPDLGGVLQRLDPGVQGALNTLALRDSTLKRPISYAITVEFRDASGTRWQRGTDGYLTELSAAKSE